MTAGSEADSAAAISGSPFEEEAVITSTLDGVKYFRSVSTTDELSFADVAADSWYYDAVDYVCAAG